MAFDNNRFHVRKTTANGRSVVELYWGDERIVWDYMDKYMLDDPLVTNTDSGVASVLRHFFTQP